MNIFKIAQGVPAGYVKVRITINRKTGDFDSRIVEHGPGVTCKTQDDDQLISDLLNTTIDGFSGDFGSVEDKGHTKEYYEELRGKAIPATPNKKQEGPSQQLPSQQQPQKQEVGLGDGY